MTLVEQNAPGLVEQELKFTVPAPLMGRLAKDPRLSKAPASRAKKSQLINVYYDTPKGDLHRLGWSVRIRLSNQQFIQTIKNSQEPSAGLFTRPEWEFTLPDNQLDLSSEKTPESFRRLLQENQWQDQIEPLFRSEIHRTTRKVTLPNVQFELALDKGAVFFGDKIEEISELELELKQGDLVDMLVFALDLVPDHAIRIGDLSKSERGYRLAGLTSTGWVKAEKVTLNPNIRPDQAFAHILASGLKTIQFNERAVREAKFIEAVHQSRVGIRRLRAAFPLFPVPAIAQDLALVREELKWLAGELGPARDWDVFVSQTLPPLKKNFPKHAGLDLLAEQAKHLQDKAYERVRRSYDHARYTQLMLNAGIWIARRPAQIAPDNQPGLVPLANQGLQKRYKKLRKLGKKYEKLDAEQRHQLRLLVKKMRYAVECFASLYSANKTATWLKSLSQLQEDLGYLNDAAVADQLLDQIREGLSDGDLLPSQVAEALGLVSGWYGARAAQATVEIAKDVKKINRLRPFWDKPAAKIAA